MKGCVWLLRPHKWQVVNKNKYWEGEGVVMQKYIGGRTDFLHECARCGKWKWFEEVKGIP